MCSCKQTKLQRVEKKIQYWGWSKLAPSDLAELDKFILEKLKVQPTNDEERQLFYTRAKQI